MALNLDTVRTLLEARLVQMGQPNQQLAADARAAQPGAPLPVAAQLHYAIDVVGTQAALDVCVLDGADAAQLGEEHGRLLRQMQGERQAGHAVDWLSQSVPTGIVFAVVSAGAASGDALASKLRRFLLDLFNDEMQVQLAKAA